MFYNNFVLILLSASIAVEGTSGIHTTSETANSIDALSGFYVITTIFNPASFKSHYTRYAEFSQHMKSFEAQLVTVECIFPTLGQTEFKVTESSNPLHIQLRSESVYWMKENLINIAVKRLPTNAKWITWIDADIILHDSNWIQKTIEALQRCSIVQVFKCVQFLNAEAEIISLDYSFGYSVVHGKPLLKYDEWYPHPGYGWAMSRSTFEEMGGLPEFGIVGSGDLYFAYTLVNQLSDVVGKEGVKEEYELRLKKNSNRIYNIIKQVSSNESKAIAGFVPVTISHRWHGSKKDRAYVERLKILTTHDFDYFRDMIRQENGLLQFGNSTQSLQKEIVRYFENRNEDSSNAA